MFMCLVIYIFPGCLLIIWYASFGFVDMPSLCQNDLTLHLLILCDDIDIYYIYIDLFNFIFAFPSELFYIYNFLFCLAGVFKLFFLVHFIYTMTIKY